MGVDEAHKLFLYTLKNNRASCHYLQSSQTHVHVLKYFHLYLQLLLMQQRYFW